MARRNEAKKEGNRRRKQSSRGIGFGFKHHQQVAVDSLERLIAEPGSSLLTWAVIGIALALPLSLLLLLQNLQQLGSGINDAAQISLYMERTFSTEQVIELMGEIELRADVAEVELITPAQALIEFQAVSGFGDTLSGLDENPLPAVLLVSPVSEEVTQAEALLTAMANLNGVDSAQLDLEWVQRLYTILGLAERMAMILAILLCVGIILVVGNTVRLSIESRRAEILVVKLVGGTDAYVARPFLYTGLWYGVGGGVIASLLVIAAQLGLEGPISRLSGLYDSNFSLLGLNISSVLLVLVGSGLLGWVGALVSVKRHLRAIEPR